MPSHSYHAPIPTHGLADGCVRCLQHAEHPFDSLDDDNLLDLVERTIRWMDDDEHSVARSRNEQKAMTIVSDALTHRRILDRLIAKAEAA